jgi:hypothetical protein
MSFLLLAFRSTGGLRVLRLQFVQIVTQAVQALVPEPAVLLDPIGDVSQRPRGKPARPPLGFAAARDQPGAAADARVQCAYAALIWLSA